ncbi:MAG TPA: SIS domain-containing protein [Terracidiphilus sp.]|nr:SIS domain-containing protein [Terracidiphilus sp.]
MVSVDESLSEHLGVMESLRDMPLTLRDAADRCLAALNGGGKLLVCGNGGSAAAAQHLSSELVGRYKESRPPLAAVTLAADAALLTCIGNDFGFEEIFSRQVHALGRPGDVLVAFTTSGRSPDILAALQAAREVGVVSVSFLGRDGGLALALSDCALVVPHNDTARIQEGHLFLMHCLMDMIEAGIRAEPDRREAGKTL